MAVPLAALFAFESLAAWYLCLAAPLRSTTMGRVLAVHGTGATVSCLLWLAAGRAWAGALERLLLVEGAARRYVGELPLLFAVGVLLFLLASAVHYVLIAFEESRQAEKRALEKDVLAREAELKALKGQINPHFLFNSLNSIAALAGSDPAAARAMCVDLADLFRKVLRLGSEERIPLSQELALANNLLAVEKVRFGARLTVEQRIEEGCGACLVPPLVLQPLVENAVTHGIAHLVEGGAVTIEARRRDGFLAITVENPFDPDRPSRGQAGVGLDNVRRRLAVIYGSGARLDVSHERGAFRVEMVLPATGGPP
jgi:LytS/YehU family sensor histidine kinase